jgi:uncharacterized HAD superfamily protein
MKNLVISIDFDGTICDLAYPAIGELKKDASKYIRQLHDDGHKIIINTCRSGKFEGHAQDFLADNNIPYDYINSNLPHLIQQYGADCRKISADIYIDDKCLMGLPETWEEIYNIVNKKANE